MSQPRIALTLEHKLRKQASKVADIARLQYKDAWAEDSGLWGQNIQENSFKNDAPISNQRVTGANSAIDSNAISEHSAAPVNALNISESGITKYRSIEPSHHVVKPSILASTPLNVAELSPNRSHLMSPPRMRPFISTSIGKGEVRGSEFGSSPFEPQSPRESLKFRRGNQATKTSHILDRPHTVEESKQTAVSFQLHGEALITSSDNHLSDKFMPTFHENDIQLVNMACQPETLDSEWRSLAQNGENHVNVEQVRAWLTAKFPQTVNDVAIVKAFQLTASSIGAETSHTIPRRAFKRLLMAVIYIKRSLEYFSATDSSSNGNPKITFEVFCSVVSKLGSKMDRKRCLFEYQRIHSRTKDYLQIDEFHSWLINSKIIPFQNERERTRSRSGLAKRSSKSPLREENHRNPGQNGNTEVTDALTGNQFSTKKFSIGVVPFKKKLDLLTHDRGQDFFRSTLQANLELQKRLKYERLENVAKVAHEQRLRSIPGESNIPSLNHNKNEYATQRSSSNIGRPTFAKMYEFIDSYLEEKLARMAMEAVLTKMDHETQRSRDEGGSNFLNYFSGQQKLDENKPKQAVFSMSPAPQPTPFMQSRPPEYPSPTPQLSDISTFDNSPEQNSPSRFSNVALGWQDTTGLPINLFTEDSPITMALKKITEQLQSTGQATILPSSLAKSDCNTTQQMKRVDEHIFDEHATGDQDAYTEMIETTLRALSPASISPKNASRQETSELIQTSRFGVSPIATQKLEVADLDVSAFSNEFSAVKQMSIPVSASWRSVLPDPSDILDAEVEDIMQQSVSINLLHEMNQHEESNVAIFRQNDPKQALSLVQDVPDINAHRNGVNEINHFYSESILNEQPMPSQANFIQIPGPTSSDDDHIEKTTKLLRQFGQHTNRSSQDYALSSPIVHSQSLLVQSSPEYAEKSSEKNDQLNSIRGRISRQRREANLLEEGIESIRGISELLERFTAIPASTLNLKISKSPAVHFEKDGRLPENMAPSEVEMNGKTTNNQTAATDNRKSFPVDKNDQQNELRYSRPQSEFVVTLLPEIVISPEVPRLKVNLAANILRDALPVQGLDTSQNESEIDESAISGEDSEEYGGNDISGDDS